MILTILVDKHLENEGSNTDQSFSEYRNLGDELESFNYIKSRSLYVTKNPYYTSNPILKEMYSNMFDKHFLKFYDYMKKCKETILDLLKVCVTEYDVVSY